MLGVEISELDVYIVLLFKVFVQLISHNMNLFVDFEERNVFVDSLLNECHPTQHIRPIVIAHNSAKERKEIGCSYLSLRHVVNLIHKFGLLG